MTTIIWIQRDFRLKDNPALSFASKLGNPVLPVFIYAPEEDHPWGIGASSRWWMHHSLTQFEKALKSIGLSLLIHKGKTLPILEKLVSQTQATHLLWNRNYDPFSIERDRKVIKMASSRSCNTQSFPGALLFEPGQVMTKQDKPYTVFTPFWKSCLKLDVEKPLGLPSKIKSHSKLKGLDVDDLQLLPKIHWDREFYPQWEPGEEGAGKRLQAFKRKILAHYQKGRDFPAEDGTSKLSAHLHFGEISPRQIWHALSKNKGASHYLREIGWREFAHQLLYFFPKTPLQPLKADFADFPWKKNGRLLHLWQQGKTGVPVVDAGMRQLWRTGWMHNRVRMIVGSYLVKDLMIPWQEGARWFWDTLVDADLGNNTLGWQWVAGCGADAAPYFRIFNPVLQGLRFDPKGEYIRQFVPELSKLPAKWIHCPDLAPEDVLRSAGVVLGKTYPLPVVNHDEARKKALKLYSSWVKRS